MTAASHTPPPPHTLKSEMRRAMRAARDAISPAEHAEAAQCVAAGALSFLGAEEDGTVAGYFPLRGEFDCLPLLARLATDGWRTALPVIVADAEPLAFRAWPPGAPLRQGPFRIPEPSADAPLARPYVLLVPLLAFDAGGHRLGYGRGFYDRTLASLRREGTPTAIGLAFNAQEVAQVPAESYDERLDWILTPSGARPCEGR